MNKKLLIIIIAVVLVVAAVLVYFLFLKGDPPIVYSYYSPGEYFVTNVKDTSRLFKTSIVLVLNTEDTALTEELTLKNALIRDTIIFILRDLSEEEILMVDDKGKLREDIISALNEKLEIDNIVEVAFNDFVIQ